MSDTAPSRFKRDKREAGFTLLEMLLVVGIVVLLAAVAAFAGRTRPDQHGAAERVLSDITRVVTTRQAQVRQLNLKTLDGGTSLEAEATDLSGLDIDFADLDTTRELAVAGVDANADNVDDNTGQQLTFNDGGTLRVRFAGRPLQLPSGWRIAQTSSDLERIPLIGGGQRQRGRVARCVSFSLDGSTFPVGDDCELGADNAARTGTRGSNMTPDDAPFLAVYAVFTSPDGSRATVAVALAVYPSGYTEPFRWDGTAWRGYNGRTLSR